MENYFDKGDVVDTRYEVKFFIEGDSYYQKYRVSGDDGKAYSLKVYNSSKLSKDDFENDKLLEVEILSLLNNEGAVKLLGSGEIVKNKHKYHYIVTEFISGETLQDKFEREGAFSQYAAVPIVMSLLETLSVMHAHPKVIIHNNINLNSINLDYSDKREKPVLMNFNFARFISSKSNSININQLNPFYIAPELYNGIFTPQSDIFSVGALLYNLVMGFPPWYIEIPKFKYTQDKYVDAINDNRTKPLTFGIKGVVDITDEHLIETIRKALSLDVDDRFNNTEEFLKALRREMVLEGGKRNKHTPKKVIKKKGKGFSAIAGMNDLKEILYNDIIRALNEPDLYERYGLTIPNGMLLYGPPGCGKTFIAERFAEEVGLNYFGYTAADFKSKYINESEQIIARIFKEAVDNAPTIIFIDEFESLVPSREGDLHEMHAAVVNEMLAQMSNCSEKGIFIIGAANYPAKIDAAVLRTGRIDRMIYLPPPDYEARLAMFELYLKDRPIDLALDYEELAKLTENYVSSDIKTIIDDASRIALQSEERITQALLEQVISDRQPSVSYSEIKKHEAYKAALEDKKETKEPKKRPIGFLHND